MRPADLLSGRSQRWPSRSNQTAFSQVVMTSPKAASTMVFPESSAETLRTAGHCLLVGFPPGSWANRSL